MCDEQTPLHEFCVELFERDNFLAATCVDIGCDPESPSSCRQSGQMCINVPDELNAPFSLLNTTCVSSADDQCSLFIACHDVVAVGQIVGTTCGVPAPTYSVPSCTEIECPAPLECIVESRGGVAQCEGPTSTSDNLMHNVSCYIVSP